MVSDQPVRPGVVSSDNYSATKILSEQVNSDFASVNNRSQVTADSAAMAASSTIPDVHISGLHSAPNNATPQENIFEKLFHDTGTVASDVGNGMWNEITQHPLDVGIALVEGAGVGLAITAAAFILPEAAVVGAVLGGGYLVAQEALHAPEFIHDALVVSNPEKHTADEVAQSHKDLQSDGQGITLGLAQAVAGFPAVGLAGLI